MHVQGKDRLYLLLIIYRDLQCNRFHFSSFWYSIAVKLLVLSYLVSVELDSFWNCVFKIGIFVYNGFVISVRKSLLIVLTNDFIFIF